MKVNIIISQYCSLLHATASHKRNRPLKPPPIQIVFFIETPKKHNQQTAQIPLNLQPAARTLSVCIYSYSVGWGKTEITHLVFVDTLLNAKQFVSARYIFVSKFHQQVFVSTFMNCTITENTHTHTYTTPSSVD